MLNVIKPKAAFDTQTIVIGRPITPFYTHYFVVFDVVGEQAADTAKRANGIYFLVNHLRSNLRLGHEGARWTSLHTFSTSHTSAAAHTVLQVKHNLTLCTTMCKANDVVDLLFAAGAHTSVALNTGIKINGHGRMRDITRRLFTPQDL